MWIFDLRRAVSGVRAHFFGFGLQDTAVPATHKQNLRDQSMTVSAQAVRAPPLEATSTFREVFEENLPYVWRALRYLGVPESDLADLCQEVFLVVHRRLEDFEGRSSVRTWIYGICLKVASSHRRRAHVRRETMQSTPPERVAVATQEQAVEQQERRDLLIRVLRGLDDEQREAFVLFEIEGRPMAEIAEILGCPLRTAYARLYAARDEIRRAWELASAIRREP